MNPSSDAGGLKEDTYGKAQLPDDYQTFTSPIESRMHCDDIVIRDGNGKSPDSDLIDRVSYTIAVNAVKVKAVH